MNYLVTQNINKIKESDIVVDSSFPENINCIRIDHHVDKCLTNIDSIYQAIKNGIKIRNSDYRLVTSSLDTDSLISAAIIDLYSSEKLATFNRDTINSNIFKIMYSSCFWCDYNINYEKFDDNINRAGELLDLYIIRELQIYIGLSYREKPIDEGQNQLFGKLVEKLKTIIKRGKVPSHILNFPREEVYNEILKVAQKCVLNHSFNNNTIGFIKTPNNEHLLPRVYFTLFKQPLIGRITYIENGEISVLIGVNPISIQNWQEINLNKLSESLNKHSEKIHFAGRRNVIRAKFKGDLEDLYNLVQNIDIGKLRDNNKLYGIYE